LDIVFHTWLPPYWERPLFGAEPLPSVNDWLVGVAPLATGISATQLKNKDLMRVGVGGALYWIAMMINQTILRAKEGPKPLQSPASEGKSNSETKRAPTPTKGKYFVTQ
jgi:hypothetical protein